MRGIPCWCRHRPDSHANRRDNRAHCIACERHPLPRLFDPVHRYQPIGHLTPIPSVLLR